MTDQWVSLVAETVKNLPAMQETGFDPWVRKIPWRGGTATHSSIFAWEIPRTEDPGGLPPGMWGLETPSLGMFPLGPNLQFQKILRAPSSLLTFLSLFLPVKLPQAGGKILEN